MAGKPTGSFKVTKSSLEVKEKIEGKNEATRAGWGLTGSWCLRDSELIQDGSELGVCLSMLLLLWLREWGDMSTTQRGGTYAALWWPHLLPGPML